MPTFASARRTSARRVAVLGVELGVGVQEEDVRAVAIVPAHVAGAREAEVFVLREKTQRKIGYTRPRVVGRSVVHDHDMKVRVPGERLDTPPEMLSTVVGDDHDIDGRRPLPHSEVTF